MAEKYDIYFLSPAGDAREAQRLADGIHHYRLPAGVKPADESFDYRRTVMDVSGEPMDEALTERLEQSRCLVLFCSPDTKSTWPVEASTIEKDSAWRSGSLLKEIFAP